MSNTPLVSVIVPIYNVEKYLKRCVDSILAQTFSDFEIILVDDGSPDGCGAICDDYKKKDDRVRVIHKENGGLSSARNAGLDIAQGKYVWFCDSDDYVADNLLDVVLPYLDDGYDMPVFQFNSVNEAGKITYTSKLETCVYQLDNGNRYDFLLNYLLGKRVTYAAWNRIYKRDIIESNHIRFEDNRRIYSEDMYFCLCYCAFANKVIVVDEPLYYYFQRSDSIMRTAGVAENLDRLSLLAESVLLYWEKVNAENDLINKFPILYYAILDIEIKTDKAYLNLTDKEFRSYLLRQIPNKSFFQKNLKYMYKLFDDKTHEHLDIEHYRQKYEVAYWQNGLFLLYRMRCLFYIYYVKSIRFIACVYRFCSYRFGRVLKK